VTEIWHQKGVFAWWIRFVFLLFSAYFVVRRSLMVFCSLVFIGVMLGWTHEVYVPLS